MAQPRTPLADSARVEAFSDGVLAVAITLLVLDLHVPESPGTFVHEILAQWQSYLAYLAAFLIIGVIWITHHALFTKIARVDAVVVTLNLLQLMLIATIPFASGVVSNSLRDGTASDQRAGLFLFAFISLALSVCWYSQCMHVAKTPALLHDAAEAPNIRRDTVKQPLALISQGAAIGVSFINPLIALAILALLPVIYIAMLFRPEKR